MIGAKKSLRTNWSRPVNSGGATPITVNSWPLRRTRRPENGRIGSELLFPHPAAEDQDGVASRHLIFVRAERALDRRLDAEQREQVRSDDSTHLQLGEILQRGGEADGDVCEGRQPFEALGPIAVST